MGQKISELAATALGRTTDLFEKVDGVSGNSEKITGDQLATMAQRGVKIYRALITQSTNSDPVAVVLENTLGGAIVWTRTQAGFYLGTLAGAFTLDKTFFMAQQGAAQFVNVSRTDDDIIQIITSEWNGAAWTEMDNWLNSTSIEVRVYI